MCRIASFLGCFYLCQALHSLPFLGLISRSYQDLLVPLRPGPVHSQQASLSLLHPPPSLCRLALTPIQSFRLGNHYLQSLLTGHHNSLEIQNQSYEMVSVASTSASVDLTAVVPALMHGLAQELGVEMNELKAILVGDETQLDLKPFQTLKEQYDQVEWDHRTITPPALAESPTMEPHLEIRLKKNTLLFQPFQTDCKPRPSDVKGARTQSISIRLAPLVHASALRSRVVWPTQGTLIAKGAPRYYQSRLFNGGKHLDVVYPEEWAHSPLPIETFPHIQTWYARYPPIHTFIQNLHWSSMSHMPMSLASYSQSMQLADMSGVWTWSGLLIMPRSTSFECVVCTTEWSASFRQWTMIGDICPSIVIQTMHSVNFHQASNVQNRFTKHHASSSHQRKRPLSHSLNRTLLTLHPSRLKKIASYDKILTSSRNATLTNCGAANGRILIEQ